MITNSMSAIVLQDIDTSHVEYLHIPTNEPWCRDHGPIFIKRDREPRLAVVDWDYNAWGGKYPPFDLDEVVPTRIAEHLRLPLYYSKTGDGGRFV